jgi:hypothetical protein
VILSCCYKLGLDEAEPNVQFLLFVGTKSNLSNCCCSDRKVQSSQDLLASSEKVGKVQRFDGHSSQEE